MSHNLPLPANRPVIDDSLLACLHCDLLQRLPASLAPGSTARCPRCNSELSRGRRDSINNTLALSVAAAALYAVANATPMLHLSAVGHAASTTVFGGARQLWHDGQQVVAVLVLFAVVIAPALQILFSLAITLGAIRDRVPEWVGTLLRHHNVTRTWSMMEVMMLGVLVALIKIAELATVDAGTGLFALTALIFVLTAMHVSFDPRDVWNRVQWAIPEVQADPTSLEAES